MITYPRSFVSDFPYPVLITYPQYSDALVELTPIIFGGQVCHLV